MKTALRTFIFVLISIRFSQDIIPAFSYGMAGNRTYLLVVLALFILCMLLPIALGILSLPNAGFSLVFFTFVMSSIVIYVSTLFIPDFSLKSANVTNLNIFGFMLPSRSFDPIWAGILSALIYSVTFGFLSWLCPRKKKK